MLSKWKWHILNENNSAWHEFLGCKYGDLAYLMLQDQVFSARNKVLLWWKDLCSVGKVEEDNQVNWFVSSISCKLGNGNYIDFWSHI